MPNIYFLGLDLMWYIGCNPDSTFSQIISCALIASNPNQILS